MDLSLRTRIEVEDVSVLILSFTVSVLIVNFIEMILVFYIESFDVFVN